MAEAVGNGVALLTAATAVTGSGDSSSASPPPLGKDVDAGVSVGWDSAVGVLATATTDVVAIFALVVTADGSAAELQPASNSATSSHCTMLVVLMISYLNGDQGVRAAAKSDCFGVLQCVDAVTGFHTRDQISAIRRHINQVHTSLIHCHRIQ